MAITIYWGSGSPYAWRVLLALELKRIPYDSKRLGFSEQELKSEEFLAINPRGQVPAIRDGAFTLYESLAILCYLDEKYPEPSLFARNAAERGVIWRVIMECVYHLEPQMTHFAGTIFSGQLAEKFDEANQSRKAVEQELKLFDQILSRQHFLAGNALTAADIAIYPVIQLLLRAAHKKGAEKAAGTLQNIEEAYPALQAWFKKIEAIPGYDRTYPPHWQ